MSEILITGGAGFIGSNIQDRLVDAGNHVTVLDNLSASTNKNLNPNSDFYEVDIRDAKSLSSAIETIKPQIIVHAAAQIQVPYSMNHPYEDHDINTLGTMNVMESARKYGVKKVVFICTGGALYGDQPEYNLPVEEDVPILKPTSFYGASKLAAEHYIRLYGNIYDIPWVSLRFANIYGPRQEGGGRAGIVGIFTKKMLAGEQPVIRGDGSHTRDYVYVDDVVDATVKAIDHPNPDYFNISSATEISNLQVFQAVKEATGSPLEPQFGPGDFGDALRSCLSNRKAANKLGWYPKTTFRQGVGHTVDYYRTFLGK